VSSIELKNTKTVNIFLEGKAMFKRTEICLMLGLLIILGLDSEKSTAANPTASGQISANKDKEKSEANSITIDFGKYKTGRLPGGFLTAVTHDGKSGKWEIIDVNGTKVLAQTDTDDDVDRFLLCVYDMVSIKDTEVSTDFIAVDGKADRAAGVVVRYKDKNNYYMARANALEDNVRLYKVEFGTRKQIGNANLKVTSGTLHNLKLAIEGKHLKVFFDGKSIIEANDGTFQNAGMVGVWTKADSVTYFKNLKIKN
jgi:hypothetical protein